MINYIKINNENNENLSRKYMTYKLVILMAMISVSRDSAKHCPDVRFMIKSEYATFSLFLSCIKVGERVKYQQNYIFKNA